LYRAKAFLVYILILLLPACTVVCFLRAPELIVQESSKAETQQVLNHVPGSTLSVASDAYLQPNIIIPDGRVLIAAWHLWLFLLALIALQLSILILSPYKFGGTIFWILCYLSLLGPAFLPLYHIKMQAQAQSSAQERLFYFFVEHQPIIWIFTFLAVALSQFICERNFARQEQ
jgi:hypothetical protein